MYKFKLPVGATVQHPSPDIELTYLGNGEFSAREPVWLLEGVTLDGSKASKEWPKKILLEEFDAPDGPKHRRVVMLYVESESEQFAEVG